MRKVESVANRAVLFPGECSHTGSSCTDEGLRIVELEIIKFIPGNFIKIYNLQLI